MKAFSHLSLLCLALWGAHTHADIGSTLQGGDITSGGDEVPGRKTNWIPIYESRVERNTEFYCMTHNPEMVIEVTGSYDTWKNDGLLRIRRPTPRGGAQTVYLEKAERFTHIDAKTNRIRILISSHSVNGKEVTDNVSLNIVLEPRGDKLVFVESSYMYSMPNADHHGDSKNDAFVCKWGPAKTMWD